MQRNTPNAMDIEPYNKPLVNSLFGSNKKDVRIANKPNKNKITAAIMFNASSNIFCLLVAAKAIINAPPKSNKIDSINWSQTYFLNKLFI